MTFGGACQEITSGLAVDLSFVLQERRHGRFRREGANLHLVQRLTLREALTGFRFAVEHLDGRRLLVASRPGEVVGPTDFTTEVAWDRFEDQDAFPGEDAGSLRTGDVEACKEVCRQRAYSGFTYWEDTAYFRAQPRQRLLAACRKSKGSTLYVRKDQFRKQRALPGEGMPHLEAPGSFGNLFILLRLDLPTELNEDAVLLLQSLGDISPTVKCSEDDSNLDELPLIDLDPVESQRQHHAATGQYEVDASALSRQRDEALPAGSPGPPPCHQM